MKAPNELNFLPDDYLERKARRRANVLCATLSMLVMGAIASAFMLTERSMRELEEQQRQVDANYAGAAKRIEQINQLRAQQKTINQRAELAASLVERVPRSNILAEFTNLLPDGVSLVDLEMEGKEVTKPAGGAGGAKSSFEQKAEEREKSKKKAKKGKKGEPEEAPQPKVKVYQYTLKVTGLADTDEQVSDYTEQLEASPLFKDVNIALTQPHTENNIAMRQFKLEMALDPDAVVSRPAALHDGATEVADVTDAGEPSAAGEAAGEAPAEGASAPAVATAPVAE